MSQGKLFETVDPAEVELLRAIAYDLDDWQIQKDENRLKWAIKRANEWKRQYGHAIFRAEVEAKFSGFELADERASGLCGNSESKPTR